MTLRDRGKLKWQGFVMPEQTQLMRQMMTDELREPKRIADEYELAEFDARLHYAIAYNLPVKLTVWEAGFTSEVVGRIHYIDEVRREVRLVTEAGGVERMKVESLVGVEVVD